MDKPDAEKFNWSSIQSNEECGRCLFAMANILGSPEAMAEWFTAQGFTDVNRVSFSPCSFILNAKWDVEKKGARIPYAVNLSIFALWFTKGANFHTQIFYEGAIPVNVSAGHHTL